MIKIQSRQEISRNHNYGTILNYSKDLIKNKDIKSIFIKESDLQYINNISILIGGSEIIKINSQLLKELDIEDGKINIMNKFIDYILLSKLTNHHMCVYFDLKENYPYIEETISLKEFKYENYDKDYDSDFGYNPEAFYYIKQFSIKSLEIYLDVFDTVNVKKTNFKQPIYSKTDESYTLKDNILIYEQGMAGSKYFNENY